MYILYPSISNYFKIWVCKGTVFFIKNKNLKNILNKYSHFLIVETIVLKKQKLFLFFFGSLKSNAYTCTKFFDDIGL